MCQNWSLGESEPNPFFLKFIAYYGTVLLPTLLLSCSPPAYQRNQASQPASPEFRDSIDLFCKDQKSCWNSKLEFRNYFCHPPENRLESASGGPNWQMARLYRIHPPKNRLESALGRPNRQPARLYRIHPPLRLLRLPLDHELGHTLPGHPPSYLHQRKIFRTWSSCVRKNLLTVKI